MIVKDVLDNMAGSFRIVDDNSGRTIAQMDTRQSYPDNDWIDKEVIYFAPSLRYFCNSKKAEYSASINIYI